jgi:hypothetical protein
MAHEFGKSSFTEVPAKFSHQDSDLGRVAAPGLGPLVHVSPPELIFGDGAAWHQRPLLPVLAADEDTLADFLTHIWMTNPYVLHKHHEANQLI